MITNDTQQIQLLKEMEMSNKNKFYRFIEMLYKKYFLYVSLAMDMLIQGGNELRTVFIENNETG